MRYSLYLAILFCCAGCISSHPIAVSQPAEDRPSSGEDASFAVTGLSSAEVPASHDSKGSAEAPSPSDIVSPVTSDGDAQRIAAPPPQPKRSQLTLSAYRPVNETSPSASISPPDTLAEEHHSTVQLVGARQSILDAQAADQQPADMPEAAASDGPNSFLMAAGEPADGFGPTAATTLGPIDMNLPTALSMVGGGHPVVGFAQWRVQEAYAQLDQAEVLWLPSLRAGFSYHKHDGNYQASDGSIVDVNRNSFQYGLGAGATGAGTTPLPGVVSEFHLADAIFQPAIAEKNAWARGHAANGVFNQQLLSVALAYLQLLDAHQDARIVQESLDRTVELTKLTGDFAATGQGLQADADRMQTELTIVESRLASAREQMDVASARLAQELSIDAGRAILPLDPTVIPIELVSLECDTPAMISIGLSNRPELKESQALVAAANEAYRRQKYAPFIPSVLLGFSNGGFGGGTGDDPDDFDSRYDFDAIVTWEVRNLGFGEGAARRGSAAQIQQARFERVRVMDQVAREIAEARAQVLHRGERLRITERAIRFADDSFRRNLSRIRDGQGLPIEVLQAIQALEAAQRAYLESIIDYNEAQFRLQYALGWPVSAPAPAAPQDTF